MKDYCKKPTWLWLLLSLPIVFIVYFAVSLSAGNIDPMDVSAVEVTAPGGESEVLENTDDIAFYVDLYLEADKLPGPVRSIAGEKPLDVVIKQKGGDTHFELFAEANTNGCFYRSDKGICFSVPSDFAKRLLRRKECDYVYARAGLTLPTLFFVTGGEETPVPPADYRWEYRDIMGAPVADTQTKKAAQRQFFSFYPKVGCGIRFSKQPSVYTMVFEDENGERLNATSLSELLFVTDTKVSVSVTASWEADETSPGGEASYVFDLLYDILPEVICSNDKVTAGEVLRVSFAHLNESESISLDTLLKTSGIRIHHGEQGSAFALIPVSVENNPGEYALVFTVGSVEKTVTLTVNAPKGEFFSVTMDPEKYTRCVMKDYEQSFRQLADSWESAGDWAKEDGEQQRYLNDKPFVAPVGGKARYGFGTMLTVNGDSAHPRTVAGMDYCPESGEAVVASQRGKIICVGEDEVYGKILVIDHGYGIKSHYYGLGSVSKEVGYIATQREAVGTVGVSGLVYRNGSEKIPTLHFFVTVNGVRVDPAALCENGVTVMD